MWTHQATNTTALAAVAAFIGLGGLLHVAQGQFARSSYTVPLEGEPIHYDRDELNDPIARLKQRIEAGEVELEYDPDYGYLPALLEALDVPESSQGLVFSRTSLQLRRISPTTPRAIYFNDDVYIGWVQNGNVIEISSTDPDVGAVFYSLQQRERNQPRFLREDQCLQCHNTARTQGVPGHLVRSVFTDDEGFPASAAPQYLSDHTSPFDQRWGGWYVTGTHGRARHMGNVTSDDADLFDPTLDTEAGANVTDLSDYFNTERYLHGGHSDIVALMILEHQTQMHNVLTRAHFEAKMAMAQQAPPVAENDGKLTANTKRRLDLLVEPVLRYMLFLDEEILSDPVEGTTSFARDFEAKGRRDSEGRSLRDLDLRRRLFKHPCSYLIHSEAFDGLPEPLKDRIYRKLWEVLTGRDDSGDYAYLATRDRGPILQILRETKDDLPDYFYED